MGELDNIIHEANALLFSDSDQGPPCKVCEEIISNQTTRELAGDAVVLGIGTDLQVFICSRCVRRIKAAR